MDLAEEKELIEKAKKDAEAFSQLYDLYYPRIFGYILRRVANVEIAQDVTSETFFKSLKGLKKFKWKGISFAVFLYRVANHEIANYFRKNKPDISLEGLWQEKGFEPMTSHNPEAELVAAQDKLKKYQDFLEIQRKIAELPTKYQEVIILKFFEKKQIKEIAEILGKKQGTVKSLLHRGLEKLRKTIAAEDNSG